MKLCQCGCGGEIKEDKKFVSGHNTRGSNHPMWKGGRKIHDAGYILIWKPEHPFCNNQGYVREHRLVMEQHLGRYLEPIEIVHHIDGNRKNNNISNLELTNQEMHAKNHVIQRRPEILSRACGICGSSNTTYRKKDKYYVWRKNPLNKDEWTCNNCYENIRRSLHKDLVV